MKESAAMKMGRPCQGAGPWKANALRRFFRGQFDSSFNSLAGGLRRDGRRMRYVRPTCASVRPGDPRPQLAASSVLHFYPQKMDSMPRPGPLGSGTIGRGALLTIQPRLTGPNRPPLDMTVHPRPCAGLTIPSGWVIPPTLHIELTDRGTCHRM